jgi:hypothetical protein
MQAKLNMHLGAEVFDRIFVGAEFNHAWQGVLYVNTAPASLQKSM